VRFHIKQEIDIPASTQLYNQICFAIAARYYPPGHRLPSTRQLAMLTGLHRNTISKVYRQLETDGVVEAIAGSGIYVRDNLKKEDFKKSFNSKNNINTTPDLEAKKAIDKLIKLGSTLQETRNLLTNEIDWRIKCGSRIIVSTPREDIGASMLIAEDLSPNINVPVEVVPMEELEKVLCNSNNGTIVTSRYFLQPLEKLAKQYRVRAIAVDLSDFQKELKIIKELKPGSCVGIVSISPGLLRAAEIIIHSMRGSDIVLMTTISDNSSRLLALLKASNQIVCDGPSLSVIENTLFKNRSQLMRAPQIICAKNYLSIKTINHLKTEIGVIHQ
jgi:GntR family transcriptional regulator